MREENPELVAFLDEQKEKVKVAREEARKIMAAKVAEIFEPTMKRVMDEYGLNGYSFGMYTPSFNDGEPCTNTMYEFEAELADDVDEAYINGEDFDPDEVDIYGFDYTGFEGDVRVRAGRAVALACLRDIPYAVTWALSDIAELLETQYDTQTAIFIELNDEGKMEIHTSYFEYYAD